MAPKKTTTRTPKKRTAHIDDPAKPGTSVNIETALLIAKGDTIRQFCEEKGEAKRRVGKINDGFNKTATKMVDGEHLHRAAANDAYALQAMEDKELHAYLYHFLFYVKDLGLLDRAKKQEEMFAAGEVGPGANGQQANGAHRDDHSEADSEAGESDGTQPDTTSVAGRGAVAARQVEEAAGDRTH